jgi:hypothetical protein
MSVAKITSKIARLTDRQAEFAAALQAAQASEVLEVGQVYAVTVGRGENKTEVQATLVAQRTNEKGVQEYRLTYGKGFEQKFVDGTSRLFGAKEGKSSAELASIVEKIGSDLESLEADLQAALAREALVVNGTYNIKIGRGANALIVPAVLLGEGVEVKTKKKIVDGVETQDDREVKVLNFFYGAGFDARTVLVSPSAVVFEQSAEDEAAATAEADASVAGAEGEAAAAEQAE